MSLLLAHVGDGILNYTEPDYWKSLWAFNIAQWAVYYGYKSVWKPNFNIFRKYKRFFAFLLVNDSLLNDVQ